LSMQWVINGRGRVIQASIFPSIGVDLSLSSFVFNVSG
jgi:hypothetical protein